MNNCRLPEELVSDIIMYSIPTYAYLWELKYNFILKKFTCPSSIMDKF